MYISEIIMIAYLKFSAVCQSCLSKTERTTTTKKKKQKKVSVI